jgi:tungstate transport system substrate-binding protein
MVAKLGLWGIVIIIAAIVSIASIGGTIAYMQTSTRHKLIVATTTSLYDTGLLDEVENTFEEKYPIDIYFISVGTGIAIQFAERGDADMLLVHAPSEELKFLQGNYGINRKIFAYNFFEIVGPTDDPAGIEGLSPIDALFRIAAAGRNSTAVWVSRGDGSGTNVKEKELWAQAGFDWAIIRDEVNWFKETGSGMGKTLITANGLEAYTLTDIGTFLAYSVGTTNQVPDLETLVTQGSELINVYSAIAVNITSNPKANFEAATTFTKFLISEEGQLIIGNYGMATYGQALFYPAADLLKSNSDPIMAQMIKDYAYFGDDSTRTECPTQYRYGHPELYD